jgi:hypothetical protein
LLPPELSGLFFLEKITDVSGAPSGRLAGSPARFRAAYKIGEPMKQIFLRGEEIPIADEPFGFILPPINL